MPDRLNRNPNKGIPKIIHQICLGSPLPEKFKHLQATWKKHHPDWEYKLWTDSDVEKMQLRNKVQYDQATNYGEKSDLLSYEILNEFGGVYVDIDFECVKPIDILVENFDFFTGVPAWVTVSLNNGLIATVPGHRIMMACVENISENYKAQTEIKDGNWGIFDRSGPFYFTKCFMQATNDHTEGVVVLPASYLYPFPPILNRANRTQGVVSTWVMPESFAIHYWAASWLQSW